MTASHEFFALCSMNKILEKCRWVMVLNFFYLLLKRYCKSKKNVFWQCVGTLAGPDSTLLIDLWPCKHPRQDLVQHPPLLSLYKDLYSAYQHQGNNEGGSGALFPGRRITMGGGESVQGRRKVPTISQVGYFFSIQHICFRKLQVRTWRRQN